MEKSVQSFRRTFLNTLRDHITCYLNESLDPYHMSTVVSFECLFLLRNLGETPDTEDTKMKYN